MKHLFALGLSLLYYCTTSAQTFNDLLQLQQGKEQLRKERAKQPPDSANYKGVIAILEKAVQLQPNNAEAHYFLACAYDYDHSDDAGGMTRLQLAKTIRSSNEVEQALRLSPQYKGEIFILDPYSKLSSIWGSLAMCYMYNNKSDSAIWAFKEGKRRGGFSNFALAFYRYGLNHCAKNAIYFQLGDYSTFACWYLQTVEKLRPDVRIVNTGMLQLPWYSSFLYRQYPTLFSSQAIATDTMLYAEWEEKTISIPVRQTGTYLNWRVYPDLGQGYILRGSLVYADILEHNAFKTKVYYSPGFDSTVSLGLDKYCQKGITNFELQPYQYETPDKATYDSLNAFPMSMLNLVNKYCNEDITAVNDIRATFFYAIDGYKKKGKPQEAKRLMSYMEQNIPESKFPLSEGFQEVLDYLKND